MTWLRMRGMRFYSFAGLGDFPHLSDKERLDFALHWTVKSFSLYTSRGELRVEDLYIIYSYLEVVGSITDRERVVGPYRAGMARTLGNWTLGNPGPKNGR